MNNLLAELNALEEQVKRTKAAIQAIKVDKSLDIYKEGTRGAAIFESLIDVGEFGNYFTLEELTEHAVKNHECIAELSDPTLRVSLYIPEIESRISKATHRTWKLVRRPLDPKDTKGPLLYQFPE